MQIAKINMKKYLINKYTKLKRYKFVQNLIQFSKNLLKYIIFFF